MFFLKRDRFVNGTNELDIEWIFHILFFGLVRVTFRVTWKSEHPGKSSELRISVESYWGINNVRSCHIIVVSSSPSGSSDQNMTHAAIL